MSPGKKPRVRKPPPVPTPKRRNPWDAPPPPRHGDFNTDITFAAVGRALTQWELFESEMAELFAVFIGANRRDTFGATRAYGAVMSFTGRTEVVWAAADVFFIIHENPNLRERVKAHIDSAKLYGIRRNEIAHGAVREFVWPPRGKQSVLGPARYSTKKNRISRASIGPHNALYPTYRYLLP